MKKVGRHLHHCRLLPPEDGYKRAIEILWKLYGNPAQIRESVIGDLKKGGPIPKNDKNALLELSLEVSAAHEVLKALSKRSTGLNYEQIANTSEIISNVLARVSFWIEEYGRWYRTSEERSIFANLRTFLELKTEDALDPLIIDALRKAKEM